MELKELTIDRLDEIINLMRQTFMEFEAPVYTQGGVNEFFRVSDKAFLLERMNNNSIKFYGILEDDELCSVIGVRNRGEIKGDFGGNNSSLQTNDFSHIMFMFTAKKWFKHGFARLLIEEAVKNAKADYITLNSSPYGVGFYKKCGFISTDIEQFKDGIYYTPMQRKL